MKRVVLVLMALVFSCWGDGVAGSLQQTSLPDASTYGVGLVSCGAWTEVSPRDPSGKAWVEGFVSAWSWAGAVIPNGKPLADTDGLAIKAFVDNYCRENPLKDVKDAAWELVLELIKKHAGK